MGAARSWRWNRVDGQPETVLVDVKCDVLSLGTRPKRGMLVAFKPVTRTRDVYDGVQALVSSHDFANKRQAYEGYESVSYATKP